MMEIPALRRFRPEAAAHAGDLSLTRLLVIALISSLLPRGNTERIKARL